MIEGANTLFSTTVGTLATIIAAIAAVTSVFIAVRSSREASRIAYRTIAEIEGASRRALQAQVTGEITAAGFEARQLKNEVDQISHELLIVLIPTQGFPEVRKAVLETWHREGTLPFNLEEIFLEGTTAGAGIDAYLIRELNTAQQFRTVCNALVADAEGFLSDITNREGAIFDANTERPRAGRLIDDLEADLIWCSRSRAKITQTQSSANKLLEQAKRLIAGERG